MKESVTSRGSTPLEKGNARKKETASISAAPPEKARKKKRKKLRKKKKEVKDLLAKHQISLYIPRKDSIQSITCDKSQEFTLSEEAEDPWWLVTTLDPSSGENISGYSSRFNFYPRDSNRDEDRFSWFLGDLSRAESEVLLLNSANPHGAYLLRYSPNKSQFVLSVKMFEEETSRWRMSHFNIQKSANKQTGKVKLSLKDGEKFSSLEELVEHYLNNDSPFILTTVCLIPNPTSDPAFLRRWELDAATDAWQLPRTEIELEEELGHGFFGTVHRGLWRNEIEVAVKTLRDKGAHKNYERDKDNFLKETEIMKKLNHPHVVKMFGVCIEKIPFYLVQELCTNGDLLHHLRQFGFLKFPHDLKKEREMKAPRFHNLLSWCLQILKGMNYLESKSLVHRDLAARNVLLDRGYQAKVADFGLTVDREEEREEEGKPVIAIYWSSPEAIDKHEFSHKSDVWSYGVTVWEILSLVDRPYNGMPKDRLKEKFREGPFIMDPPKNYFHTQQYIMDMSYRLMKECWARDPSRRPSFASLQPKLEKIIAENITARKRRPKKKAWNDQRHPKSDSADDESDLDRFEPDYERSHTTTIYDYEHKMYERHKR